MGSAGFPEPVIDLIDELKRLPGIGPRGAERVAVWLLQHEKSNAQALAEVVLEAKTRVHFCDQCGFFCYR